ISQFVEGTPPELERIVRKALRKDRNERYQIAKEMAIDLRSLRRELEMNSMLERSISSGTGVPAGPGKAVKTDEWKQLPTEFLKSMFPLHRSGGLWLAAVVVLLSVIAGLFLNVRSRRSESKMRVPFGRVEVTKLTTNGNALLGAISPDGKYVAYVTGESGKQSLWLRQVDINSNAQLIAPRAGHYLGVVFSPDGNYIYFGYAESGRNDATQIYRLPVLGIGAAATRMELQQGLHSLSHDRKRMALIRFDRQAQTDSLIVANADGSGEQ